MKKILLTILGVTALFTGMCGCNRVQSQAGRELTIATLFESPYLTLAAQRYEALHESTTITIKAYSTKEGQQLTDTEIYSQYINTALMSGLGEDIIDVRRLAWVHLADKGKLFDMQGAIEWEKEDYYQNILDAFIYNGARYVTPLNFNFDVFTFSDAYNDIEIPDRFTSDWLVTMVQKNPDAPLFRSSSSMSPTALAFRWFLLDFQWYVDVGTKEAYIDNERFINLLESIQSISGNLRGSAQGESSLMLQLIMYNAVSSTGWVEDYQELFLLGNEDGKGLFSTIEFLPAINANSKNKELAVDFIRFLLSAEMQASPELMYCPVNRTAAADIAAIMFAETKQLGFDVGTFDLEKNMILFDALAEQLNVVEYSDFVLTSFVYDELARFFAGEVNAALAAKNLQARLNTYLKE